MMTSISQTLECANVSAEGPVKFCPHKGRLPNTSVVLAGQLQTLLAARLKIATVLVSVGLGSFVVRNLFVGLTPQTGGLPSIIPQATVAAVVAGVAVLLFVRRSGWTFLQLRACEVVVFGLTAVSLAWLQWCIVRYCPQDELESIAAAYPARTTVPWILLIQIYGLFIPNTWRRAAAAVVLLAIAPLAVATVAGAQQPLVQSVLNEGGRSAMFLWLAIASSAGIYGSHRFSSMRRETLDARTLGLYTLREKLGEGGMGEVYLAEHQLLKRPCAIKLVRAEKAGDPKAIARFQAEVQSTAGLSHPNTVEIYDFGITDDGTFFYVMEFLPGMSLEEIVNRYGPLPPERLVYLLRMVCSALAEAHAAGLIHRDIKPGNIFVAERGGLYDVVKLLDFGLVKSVTATNRDASLTMEGSFVGSPLYSPPESILSNGESDGRADIYSLGATAYHLLTGQPVFQGSNPLQVVFAHANEAPVAPTNIREQIPAELEAIVMKCLEKRPEDRFADVTALGESLSQCPLRSRWDQTRAKAWWTENRTATDHEPVPAAETVTRIGIETA